MRVGVLTTSYPRFGGDNAGHFVAGFADWMAQKGCAVDVLAAASTRTLFYRGGAPDALLHRVAIKPWLAAAQFSAALARATHARAKKWDAIVSHWITPAGIIGDVVARNLFVPHLAIAHGSDIALLDRARLAGAVCRRIAKKSDLVFVANALRPASINARVVAMGCDAPPPLDAREQLRAALGWHRPTALFLGRLTREKGVDLAIDAVTNLPLDLVIAGEGPLDALAQGAPPNVRFVGAQLGLQKWRHLHAADFLIVPSRRDGAPTVIKEAMTLGTPIIATAVGGIGEEKYAGTHIVAPTVAALRTAIQNALATPLSRSARTPTDWSIVGEQLWPAAWQLPNRAPGTVVVTRI